MTTPAKHTRPAPAVRVDQAPTPHGPASYLDRLRTGGWRAVGAFLAIALVTLLVLVVLMKKTSATHLTIGAGMVMLLYLTVGGFMVLASLIFVPRRGR